MDIFEFTFTNRLGFLIAFIPGLFNLCLVGYILFFLPRNKLTNIFALFTLALSLWQTDDTLARITTTPEAADIWDCIFSPAWILAGPLCLHFSLLYCQIVKEEIFRLFIALIYLPAFIFTGIYQSHLNPHIFLQSGIWGWINYYNNNLADELMIWWISLMVLGSCFLLAYKTWSVRKHVLLRNQSLLITVGIAVPTIAGIVTQMVFPILLGRPPIPITSTFMTFFSLATVIALTRFRLFSVSELISGDALIESLPVMLFSVSGTKQITFVNKYGRETLGVSADDIHDMDFDEVFRPSPDQQISLDQVWEQAIKGKSMHSLDMSLVTARGVVDISVSASPIVNNYKIQGVLFAARDVTELKRSHQLVRHNEELLKEAQALSHIGSWEWDIETNAVNWSDEMYRIYGYEPGQIKVAYGSYLDKLHPDDKEAVDRIVRRAFADHLPFEFYHRIIPANGDGQMRLLHARGSVTVDSNGAAIRMNGTSQDVTVMKESEEKLRMQNLELQKIYSELDQFVYRVSHDLRSPLTSMQGLIDIATAETKEPVILEYLELLKNSVEEQDKFICDILDHFKNSRMEVRHESVNLEELLTPIIDHQKKLHDPNKVVEAVINIKQKTPFFSDKARLTIIFKNLISNAIIFSDNKDKLSLNISVSINTDSAIIDVRDNGIGITAEQQNKVFEMFYRGSKQSMGSGLGLYIVKDTVQKLHGSISLSSRAGEGTNFTIRLPNDAGPIKPS